ncbi:MAG: hypothetical protein ABIK83_07820 [Candidatus Zixiibacteriota bacterium]
MIRLDIRTSWFFATMIILAIVMSCEKTEKPSDQNPSVTFNYKLSLNDRGIPVGGLCLDLLDLENVVDSQDIHLTLADRDLVIARVDWNASSSSWRFVFLKKHGTIASGILVDIETEAKLGSQVQIVEACDTLGNPISPDDVKATLSE